MPRGPRKNMLATMEEDLSSSDAEKTITEWNSLSMEVLKLKANQYGLITTGKKNELVRRLREYFAKTSDESATANNINANDNNTSGESNMELILAEVRALRSEVSAVKNKQTEIIRIQNSGVQHESSQNIPSPVRNIGTDNNQLQFAANHSHSSTRPNEQSNDDMLAEKGISESYQQQHQGRNFISIEEDEESPSNPFIPPPIKTSLLKKIEKREFVDFDDLLPVSGSVSNNITKQWQGTPYIDIDVESSALHLRQGEKKTKINNLSSWMSAWNIYMQAYLHYRPDMYYQFFAYQKIFCRIVGKYKFEACYNYDKDLRLLMASQISLSPKQRTASWDSLHIELSNIHLADNLMPSCFTCKAVGHFSSTCPQKSSKNSSHDSFRNQQLPFFRPYSEMHSTNNSSKGAESPANPNGNNYSSGRQSNPIPCQRWNKSGFCAKPPCQYAHVCNKCAKANHPGIRCFSRTSTNFLP